MFLLLNELVIRTMHGDGSAKVPPKSCFLVKLAISGTRNLGQHPHTCIGVIRTSNKSRSLDKKSESFDADDDDDDDDDDNHNNSNDNTMVSLVIPIFKLIFISIKILRLMLVLICSSSRSENTKGSHRNKQGLK